MEQHRNTGEGSEGYVQHLGGWMNPVDQQVGGGAGARRRREDNGGAGLSIFQRLHKNKRRSLRL